MPIRPAKQPRTSPSGRNDNSPRQTPKLPQGTTVVSSTLGKPTPLLVAPNDSAKATDIQPGTALKIVDYRDGWHKVETFVVPKTRGWISTLDGPALDPQLTLPTCDQKYTDFRRVGGEVFIGPVSVNDINQGYLADCYLVAALTALAKCSPSAIKDSIRKGDEPGSYIVTLRRVEKAGGKMGSQTIKLDNWFPTKEGRLLYAQGGFIPKPRFSVSQFEGKKRPLWPAILEKAFAVRSGGYNKVERGVEGDIFEALTGKATNFYSLGKPGSKQNEEAVVELKKAVRAHLPVAAATKSSKQATMPPRIHDDHVYVAVGYSKDKVILKNPHDPRESLAISYDEFSQAFERVTIGKK